MQRWLFDIRSGPFLALSAAFLVVTLFVYAKIPDPLDHAVAGYLEGMAGNGPLDVLMQYVTETGDVFSMLAFAVIVILLRRTRKVGISLMILLVVTTIATGYVKCGVDRERPDTGYEGPDFPLPVSRDTFALFCEGGLNASYPSGHAARTMVFAIVLGYALSQRFPRGCYLLLLYPGLVSISRVYLTEHYVMDVVGGMLVAALLAGTIAKKTKLHTVFDAGGSAGAR